MIVEMENYKSEVKKVTQLNAIDTITLCYFVILCLSWNSVISLVLCHFWLQILKVTKLSFYQFPCSLDFHEKKFYGPISYIIINFFAKFH